MRLKKGDLIGLVAPANYVDLNKMKSAIENLEKIGFKVKLGKSAEKRWYSFAGKDKERAEDINEFFKDENIKGIMCLRGGYGSTRLLSLLDYKSIKKNPKPFIGYSDITSLLLALYKKCNMKSYHGPMAVSNFSGEYDKQTLDHFMMIITGEYSCIELDNFGEPLEFYNELRGEGILIGGNLAVLVSNLKSEYDIDYKDKILFLEEISEDTYKVDRMLWELKNLGIFEEVSGIIIGDFKNCNKGSEDDMTLQEVFDSHFKELKKPICYNYKSGHSTPMQTMEFGSIVEIRSLEKKIILKRN